ncbi:MAG: UDP-N-acetylglucosamine diphosphorylase/glucosamine-1-phosphate N-acetyltransferase [Dehalococcoidia bacterium]|nr:UDP-N-acetylglucosamine diphosphorylase/glucosamine-1-phosphate N-acetyltransferase [Dehalococcoidia bacterium]
MPVSKRFVRVRRVFRKIRWAGVVLAAGKSTRMKSSLPKVLHKICGAEMIRFPLTAVWGNGVDDVVVVVSPDARQLRALLKDTVEYAVQNTPRGTGHALLQAGPLLNKRMPAPQSRSAFDHILVLNGDLPLIQKATLSRLMLQHISSGCAMTILVAEITRPEGYGRILRDKNGDASKVIEDKEADEKQQAISEINVGAYCFRSDWLWQEIKKLKPSASGEIYLVDLVESAAKSGGVYTVQTTDASEAIGINNRVQLADAEQVIRRRIRERWMLDGVTIMDPASTFIDNSVKLSQDVTIHPGTHILGKSSVGPNTSLGPYALIRDSKIASSCTISQSTIEGSVIEDGVDVGPYCHIRPGSHIEKHVHLGNYVEVKNSRIGERTQSGHFSYLGDATIGKDVNIGAGTITCNYDGTAKHRTVIEDSAFIGSDTMLVAPVKIGKGARTGAGSVVTHDVLPGQTVVGVPARPLEKKSKR